MGRRLNQGMLARMRRRWYGLGCALLLSSCSFLVARPSPGTWPRGPGESASALPKCNSYAFPTIDLLGGGALAGLLAASAALGELCDQGGQQAADCMEARRHTYYLSIGVLATFVASSIYGYTALTICNDRMKDTKPANEVPASNSTKQLAPPTTMPTTQPPPPAPSNLLGEP
jgi:hypothetical protein